MNYVLKYMQLRPVDISPIYTGEKSIIQKILPLTLKPSEIRSLTLEEKGYLNIDIKLGEIQQERPLWLMMVNDLSLRDSP